jgi:hypothetical protein
MWLKHAHVNEIINLDRVDVIHSMGSGDQRAVYFTSGSNTIKYLITDADWDHLVKSLSQITLEGRNERVQF